MRPEEKERLGDWLEKLQTGPVVLQGDKSGSLTQVVLTVVCALVLTGCTYFPRGNYFSKGIAQYSGDKTIRDISHRSLIFPSRGYIVDLADFDLSTPFTAQFRLAGIPIIKGSGVTIYY